MRDRIPDEIDEALWDEACRRADALREFLRRNPDGATAANVSGLAAGMNVSQATAYRLIKLFRVGGTDRKAPTRSLTLASGDVIGLGGPARLAFHGIDRVRAGSSGLIPGGGRLSLTLRYVGA